MMNTKISNNMCRHLSRHNLAIMVPKGQLYRYVDYKEANIRNKIMISSKNYCKHANLTSASNSSSQIPPPPNPPRLPNKAQLEKFMFRTIAFAWDITHFTYLWLLRNFHVYVAQHPTVRTHWKTFLEKLENSRKD